MKLATFENGSATQTGFTTTGASIATDAQYSADEPYTIKVTTADSVQYGIMTSAVDSNAGNVQVSGRVRGTVSSGTGVRIAAHLRSSSADPANNASYMAYMNFNAGAQLFNRASGSSNTQLGSTVGSSSTFVSGTWYQMIFRCTSTHTLTLQVQRLSDLKWLNSSGTWVDDSTGTTTAITHDDSASGSKITGTGYAGIGGLLVSGSGTGVWIDEVLVNYDLSTEAVRVDADSSDLFFSPYAWRTTGSGATAKKITANTGNYFKAAFTGPTCSLLVDTGSFGTLADLTKTPRIKYSVDNGVWRTKNLRPADIATGIPIEGISGTGSHTLQVYYMASTSTDDNWTTPVNSLIVSGLRLGTGYASSAVTPLAGRLLVYGDSIARGAASAQTSTSVPATDTRSITDGQLGFPIAMGQALQAEVGVIGFSGQGWTVTGSGNAPVFGDSWDNYSNGQSRLSTGLLSPEPDWIVIIQGTNDASAVAADVTAAIHNISTHAGILEDIRAAAGSSTPMFLCVPFGGFQSTAISDAFDDYMTDNASDTNIYLVDLGSVGSVGLTDFSRAGASINSYDSLHPNQSTHGRLGASLVYEIMDALSGAAPTYTAASNVRSGTDRGDGVTGTLAVPTASQVLSGVSVDATTGNVALPSVGDVQDGVAFGPSSGSTGTFVVPSEAEVESGVGFGSGGTEFTGTLTGGGYSRPLHPLFQQVIG